MRPADGAGQSGRRFKVKDYSVYDNPEMMRALDESMDRIRAQTGTRRNFRILLDGILDRNAFEDSPREVLDYVISRIQSDSFRVTRSFALITRSENLDKAERMLKRISDKRRRRTGSTDIGVRFRMRTPKSRARQAAMVTIFLGTAVVIASIISQKREQKKLEKKS